MQGAQGKLTQQALAPDDKGATPHNLAGNGMAANWSISPSGKTVGWNTLSIPPGIDPELKRDTAFAMLREVLRGAEGRAADGMFWVRPDVYDQVPGMRQMLLDAGGTSSPRRRSAARSSR